MYDIRISPFFVKLHSVAERYKLVTTFNYLKLLLRFHLRHLQQVDIRYTLKMTSE